MSNNRYIVHENRAIEFGPVDTWAIIIPEAIYTHGDAFRVYAQSSTEPGFFRELYIHSHFLGQSQLPGSLLSVVDPADETPSLRRLSMYGDFTVFRDDLYSKKLSWEDNAGIITLSPNYLRHITPEQEELYLQLFPRQ